MEDEKGVDEKIIAVPIDEPHPYYKRVRSYRDLPESSWSRSGISFSTLQGS
jgi:inorganic pyrophosphatase